jgi:hypothetical protein
MNDFGSHHEPSREFRAQLKRDISRAVRNDQRFGSAAAVDPRRLTMIVGVAAAAVLTLATGMVLGASVSYASAATPNALAPALAIRPIGSAINALRCTPAVETPPKATVNRTAPATPAAPAVVAAAETTTSIVPPTPGKPDRARVAALARQHQPAVVRGDSAAEYLVMVVDAAEKYLWSTHGSGGLAIEVAGDARTPLERQAYIREHRAEFGQSGFFRLERLWIAGDSMRRMHPDSFSYDYYSFSRAGVAGGSATGRAGGGRGVVGGKITRDTLAWTRMRRDSAGRYTTGYQWIRIDSSSYGYRLNDSARFDYRRAEMKRGLIAFSDSSPNKPGVYLDGWWGPRNAVTNQAAGLQAPKAGESGIQGLPSASVAMTETYHFGPGELAPKPISIIVVRLTPGAAWKGRD